MPDHHDDTTVYEVPDNPTEPETAALELIVRLPREVFDSDAFTIVLQATAPLPASLVSVPCSAAGYADAHSSVSAISDVNGALEGTGQV